jgi:hypothetical protein
MRGRANLTVGVTPAQAGPRATIKILPAQSCVDACLRGHDAGEVVLS